MPRHYAPATGQAIEFDALCAGFHSFAEIGLVKVGNSGRKARRKH
jgi:hypothetical protein